MSAKKEKVQRVIEIPELNQVEMSVWIVGTSPLLTHRMGDEQIQAMEEKKRGVVTKATRDKKNPQKLFETSQYKNSPLNNYKNGAHLMPSISIKKAMVSSSRSIQDKKMPMTFLRGAFYVAGPFFEIVTPNEPQMYSHLGMTKSGTLDERYMALYDPWKANLKIRFDPDLITEQQILLLLRKAGRHVGIGALRIETVGGRDFGLFDVSTDDEIIISEV